MSSEDTLVADILALIHQREAKCKAELMKLNEIRAAIQPTGGLLVETVNDAPTRRRTMSAATRARMSRRMKAVWRKRKLATK